jgi:hypothetical protein
MFLDIPETRPRECAPKLTVTMKPDHLPGKLSWIIREQDIFFVSQVHSFRANGSGYNRDSEAHALIDLPFHSSPEAQRCHGQEAGFKVAIDVLDVTVGDDAVAGELADGFGHFAADNVERRSG